MAYDLSATTIAHSMTGPLVNMLYALARLMEAECEALVGGHAPDALRSLAAAQARLLVDMDRLESAEVDPALMDAVAALRDAATMQAAIIGERPVEKKWPPKPKRLHRA